MTSDDRDLIRQLYKKITRLEAIVKQALGIENINVEETNGKVNKPTKSYKPKHRSAPQLLLTVRPFAACPGQIITTD